MISWSNVEQLPVQSYRERRPAAKLAGYVTCIWMQQVASDASPYTHRTIPNGSAELVCEQGLLPRVIGPQTGPIEETRAPGLTVVGARFRPGAVSALLGLPAVDFVDVAFDADEVWGDAAVALGEAVGAARSPEAGAAALESMILRRLDEAALVPDPIAIEAARRLMQRQGGGLIRVASSLNISARQLRRRCETATGFTPKVLQRIIRFQAFVALAQTRPKSSGELAWLAAEAGYADQAHLARESNRLAGHPPGTLLLETHKHCGAFHDHAVSHGPLLASLGALEEVGSAGRWDRSPELGSR